MIDLVVGPQAYHRLPEMVAEAARGGRPVDTDMPAISKFDAFPARRRASPSAFLTVQEGCDKFCTYCVVPYTRGAEIRGRGPTSSPRRTRWSTAARARSSCSARTSMPGRDGGRGLAELIRALAKIDGLERIRYTTSHPADMTDALIAAHGEVDKLMPYLHLPVQSGSNRILKAMNRSHTAETYLRDAREGARRAARHRHCPATSSSAFPAKPKKISRDAEHRRCGRLRFGLFVQIQRPPGHSGGDDGGPDRARGDGRAAAAAAGTDRRAQLAFNRASVGKDTQILIERKGRLPGQMIGRSPWLQSVHRRNRRRARRHAST